VPLPSGDSMGVMSVFTRLREPLDEDDRDSSALVGISPLLLESEVCRQQMRGTGNTASCRYTPREARKRKLGSQIRQGHAWLELHGRHRPGR
jgi:hypothetical protein